MWVVEKLFSSLFGVHSFRYYLWRLAICLISLWIVDILKTRWITSLILNRCAATTVPNKNNSLTTLNYFYIGFSGQLHNCMQKIHTNLTNNIYRNRLFARFSAEYIPLAIKTCEFFFYLHFFFLINTVFTIQAGIKVHTRE